MRFPMPLISITRLVPNSLSVSLSLLCVYHSLSRTLVLLLSRSDALAHRRPLETPAKVYQRKGDYAAEGVEGLPSWLLSAVGSTGNGE